MSTASEDSPVVSFSIRAYRLLVGAYPTAFRQEYGEHMLQLFGDCSRRQYRQKGASGMLMLWAVTLFDFVRSVVAEHLQRETVMTKQLFIRLSGWALLLGGVLIILGVLAISFEDSRYYYTYPELRGFFSTIGFGLMLGPMFVGVGMLGLLARFGQGVGLPGQAALLAGAIGGLLAYPLAELLAALFPEGGFEGTFIWPLIFFSLLGLLFLGMGLYGLMALRRQAMPRWNGLPVLAGFLLPTLIVMELIWGWSERVTSQDGGAIIMVVLVVSAVPVVLLGYVLQGEYREEPAIV
jgi:hypothetical protein